MAINKVVYGNDTLIDLTNTTATADRIVSGVGAYGADGVWMDGTLTEVFPSDDNPAMDGTASPGVSINYSRADHVHPHDSSIPTKISDLTNDSGFITGITSADVTTALGYTPPTQDTTYESKAAVSGGMDVSLVTTGEKYTWNNKGTYSKPSGGIPASDLASGVIPTVPTAYTSNPAMDGTASPGSSGSWAKGDHVHPKDTSKQNKITASGILKGNGSGGVSAATAGTDYITPTTLHSPWSVHDSVTSYAIVAGDANKTIRLNQTNTTVTLTQAVSTKMANGTEIGILLANTSASAVLTVVIPSGRAYKIGSAFTKVKITGCYGLCTIKKMWAATADVWLVTAPNVEVVS